MNKAIGENVATWFISVSGKIKPSDSLVEGETPVMEGIKSR